MVSVSGTVRTRATRLCIRSAPVSVVRASTRAPRACTSTTLLMALSNRGIYVAAAITGVPSSIREMVPCFSSPEA